MKSLTNKLYDIRFAIGEWFVNRTIFGKTLWSSFDSLEEELAEARANCTNCNCKK